MSANHTVLLLFPNQLIDDHAGFSLDIDDVVLIEDDLFFKDCQYSIQFHNKKLMLHRASMKAFAAKLVERGLKVSYFNWQPHALESLLKKLTENETSDKPVEIIVSDTVDFALNKRLKALEKQNNIKLRWLRSQLFLNSNEENTTYRAGKKRWFMADFYKYQRRKFDILMESDGKPTGGKWSFDEENRKKIPKKLRKEIPVLKFPSENEWVIEAREYVNNNFPQAFGSSEDFEYPITHDAALAWLDEFIQQRFTLFGPYEDALVPGQGWLYHSVLTPLLNIGLLTPKLIIDKAISYTENHEVPISSLEGFIRQIIGWREFMRATYVDLGVDMRTTNHWNHTRKIPSSFYTGTTEITPIDDVIKRTLKTGYCHHIERLMVLGGFMFLCEFDPDEIYRWFMELFIDSYDWVMVPNVYAMSQNADGGLITTKPYFSGSSYLKKMGYDDLEGDWCEVWDGLYWKWINEHQDTLSKNPRWAMMCAMARKMDSDKLNAHISNAEAFLLTLNDDSK
jgi:deoxyribodipyrimidine photolyase-related protein